MLIQTLVSFLQPGQLIISRGAITDTALPGRNTPVHDPSLYTFVSSGETEFYLSMMHSVLSHLIDQSRTNASA